MALFDRSMFSTWGKGPKNRPPFEAFYIYILALAAGYMMADLGTLYVRPAMLPTQPPPSRPVRAPRNVFTSIEQYNKIRDRNVFNADGKIPPALTAEGGDENNPS